MKEIKENKTKKNNGNLSLYPLKFEDAVKCMLEIPPIHKCIENENQRENDNE